ncbi:hypothetical protein QN348_14805 [Mucilaginibacter sp. 5C4]|nr:hypothetical protein [Mucilaginibacter sp. 5C4]
MKIDFTKVFFYYSEKDKFISPQEYHETLQGLSSITGIELSVNGSKSLDHDFSSSWLKTSNYY